MKSAAARCSAALLSASCSGDSERSAVPAPPLVHSTYVTSQPAATHLATTPPDPISASSGWAKITMARSGTSATTSSFPTVRSFGLLAATLVPPDGQCSRSTLLGQVASQTRLKGASFAQRTVGVR